MYVCVCSWRHFEQNLNGQKKGQILISLAQFKSMAILLLLLYYGQHCSVWQTYKCMLDLFVYLYSTIYANDSVFAHREKRVLNISTFAHFEIAFLSTCHLATPTKETYSFVAFFSPLAKWLSFYCSFCTFLCRALPLSFAVSFVRGFRCILRTLNMKIYS